MFIYIFNWIKSCLYIRFLENFDLRVMQFSWNYIQRSSKKQIIHINTKQFMKKIRFYDPILELNLIAQVKSTPAN
jgi:hypothetical protein